MSTSKNHRRQRHKSKKAGKVTTPDNRQGDDGLGEQLAASTNKSTSEISVEKLVPTICDTSGEESLCLNGRMDLVNEDLIHHNDASGSSPDQEHRKKDEKAETEAISSDNSDSLFLEKCSSKRFMNECSGKDRKLELLRSDKVFSMQPNKRSKQVTQSQTLRLARLTSALWLILRVVFGLICLSGLHVWYKAKAALCKFLIGRQILSVVDWLLGFHLKYVVKSKESSCCKAVS